LEQQAQAVRTANQEAAQTGRPLCEQCEEDARSRNPSGDPVGSDEGETGATQADQQARPPTGAEAHKLQRGQTPADSTGQPTDAGSSKLDDIARQ
jgi:hypothetical protein